MLARALQMKSRKMLARDVFDTFATHPGLVYDVIDTTAAHKIIGNLNGRIRRNRTKRKEKKRKKKKDLARMYLRWSLPTLNKPGS